MRSLPAHLCAAELADPNHKILASETVNVTMPDVKTPAPAAPRH